MEEMPVFKIKMWPEGVDEIDKMADVRCSTPAAGWLHPDGVDEIDMMLNARWKRTDELEIADEMEKWGHR